ncbi:MAG: biotin/lipoyl-binding protein, partial [Planctomycetaceae bacterium]|nr:biotin/lipoyl-binding protein [Planctomycetaceae bacterium]
MAMQFNLPDVSEGVTSVDIAEILVSEGDMISAGAVVCEVETDKAVAEINCPFAGRISRILVSTGDSVPIGQPLLEIETENAAATVVSEPPAAPVASPVPAESTPDEPAA